MEVNGTFWDSLVVGGLVLGVGAVEDVEVDVGAEVVDAALVGAAAHCFAMWLILAMAAVARWGASW